MISIRWSFVVRYDIWATGDLGANKSSESKLETNHTKE